MKRLLSVVLAIIMLLSVMPMSSFALSWDGSSAGGGGGGSPAGANGYAVRTTSDNCIGYRFSVVNSSGANKVAKVMDVYRDTSYGNLAYTDGYKFSGKYNKRQLISKQNDGFSTARTSNNCYKETDCDFQTWLPVPSEMEDWQNIEKNINVALTMLGVGSVANMNYGDMVIIEPIYDVRLQSIYHSVTVTEIALYGKYILGASSNGGASSNPASWGFISKYTNRAYPNSLFTPNGQGLWTAASELSDRETFYTIINSGYGAGIGYKETRNITYTIKFYGNGSTSGSTASMAMTYNTAKALTANGFAKTGYHFGGWNTQADGTGTSYYNKQSVKNLTAANGEKVNLYAQWTTNSYTIAFNGNGSTAGTMSDMTMTYAQTKNLTKNAFIKTGYDFTGWNTKTDGSGTAYKDEQAVTNLVNVNNGSITLYAQWEFVPNLLVNACDAYKYTKGNTEYHYGQSIGNSFVDFSCDKGYAAKGDDVWFEVYFPKENITLRARQYVRCGGDWITRDVTLDSSRLSQCFSVQFTGWYKTVSAQRKSFIVDAKTDWLDADGNVIKTGKVYSFYVPVQPQVYRDNVTAVGYDGRTRVLSNASSVTGKLYSGQRVKLRYQYSTTSQWDAQECLAGTLYGYDGAWKPVYTKDSTGYDAFCRDVSMTYTEPTKAESLLNPYTVPKTSNGKLRVKLESWWSVDKNRTQESTWFDLPVSLSDVAQSSYFQDLDKKDCDRIFVNAVGGCIAYMMMARCGLNARECYDFEAFRPVLYFNTAETVTILGNACSDIAEMGLREIESTVRHLQKEEKNSNRTFVKSAKTEYDEAARTDITAERSKNDDRDSIHEAGRLS